MKRSYDTIEETPMEHNIAEFAQYVSVQYNLHLGGKVTQKELLESIKAKHKELKKCKKNLLPKKGDKDD
jgi:hypothetical protein